MSNVVLFIILLLPCVIYGLSDCKAQIRETDREANVLLNVLSWTQPSRNQKVNNGLLSNGQVVNMECPNGFVRNDLPQKSYTFQCTNGLYNRTFPYDELLCRSDYHKHSVVVRISPIQIRSRIFHCDSDGWELYQMKTLQADGTSKLLYLVCLDRKVMRPKFVFQPSTTEKPPRGYAFENRTDVWGFDGYGSNANEMIQISKGYVGKIQRNRTTNFFPNKFRNGYPYYFNRGHLVPYADFKDANDRKATCQYFNAAPQWDAFNGNQWSLVERQARKMRQNNPEEWEVYTGTYGTIPTPKGPLFVASVYEKRELKKKLLPVPMLYWKLIYNTNNSTKSKAFVGVNNPEIQSPQQIVNKYKICNPIPGSNNASFEGSEFFGFTYQCKVNDFIEALKKEEKIVKTSFGF